MIVTLQKPTTCPRKMRVLRKIEKNPNKKALTFVKAFCFTLGVVKLFSCKAYNRPRQRPQKVNSNKTSNINPQQKRTLKFLKVLFYLLILQLLSTLFLFTAVHKLECFAWCIDCVQDVALVFGANNNVSVYALTFAFGSNVFAVL